MELKTRTKVKLITGAFVMNALFGLYNLKVTERVKSLSNSQKGAILIIDTLNTFHGFVHLLVNIKIGAYNKN